MVFNRKVLISSAGTGNAFAAIKALRNNFTGVKIITMDINPKELVTASLFSDNHIIAPKVVEKGYEEFIIKKISDFKIDTYIPFLDHEVTMLAKLFYNGKVDSSLCVQLTNPENALLCQDKLRTYQFLKKEQLPTPKTSSLKKPFSADSYILKPINGFGSKIKIIKKEELSGIDKNADYVLQEMCEGAEITIDVSYSLKFNLFHHICRERLETKSGVCTKARLFQDNELGQLALVLSKKLGLHSFCFQVMKLSGSWKIIDINPRLGAGTSMSAVVGSDFYSAMFAILWGLNPAPFLKKLDRDYYVTRQYTEYLMQ
jgi:predicted ATP-grasp superfamily ATP-dependent carboligase